MGPLALFPQVSAEPLVPLLAWVPSKNPAYFPLFFLSSVQGVILVDVGYDVEGPSGMMLGDVLAVMSPALLAIRHEPLAVQSCWKSFSQHFRPQGPQPGEFLIVHLSLGIWSAVQMYGV